VDKGPLLKWPPYTALRVEKGGKKEIPRAILKRGVHSKEKTRTNYLGPQLHIKVPKRTPPSRQRDNTMGGERADNVSSRLGLKQW